MVLMGDALALYQITFNTAACTSYKSKEFAVHIAEFFPYRCIMPEIFFTYAILEAAAQLIDFLRNHHLATPFNHISR